MNNEESYQSEIEGIDEEEELTDSNLQSPDVPSDEKLQKRKFYDRFSKSVNDIVRIHKTGDPKQDETSNWKNGSRFSLYFSDKKTKIKKFVGGSKKLVIKPRKPVKNREQKQDEHQSVKLNEKGCSEFFAQNYREAFKLYSEALTLWPTNAYYLTNRAACYIEFKNYQRAIDDVTVAIELNPSFLKAYLRAVSCFLVLGELGKAQNCIIRMRNRIAVSATFECDEIKKFYYLMEKDTRIVKLYANQKYEECVMQLEEALMIASLCINYRNMKAECLVMLENNDAANKIIKTALNDNPENAFMIYLQGLSSYLSTNLKCSIEKLKLAIEADPDFTKAKELCIKVKQISSLYLEGMAQYGVENYEKAIEAFTTAAKIDSSSKNVRLILMYNRGSANFHLKRYEEARDDFTDVQKINQTHVKSLLKRAKAYFQLNEFKKCILDCQKLMFFEPTDEVQQLMNAAMMSSKARKYSDCLAVLGVTDGASTEELKKQYHIMCLKFHPDKHALDTDKKKKVIEQVFKEIKEAYEYLMNLAGQ